jgi:hypothetical protein
MDWNNLALRVAAFLLGGVMVWGTLASVIKTLILPRSAPDFLSRTVFVAMRSVFYFRLRWARSYAEQDDILSFFAPVSLLMLLPIWYTAVLIAYGLAYWALGSPWNEALHISGSSVFTLGYTGTNDLPRAALTFSEAALGLLLVALLIAYLPTMYAAFSRREAAVNLLEVRAGNPPAAAEMLKRYHRLHGLDQLHDIWHTWEAWFADVEESHTSLPALVFFRSPRPEHSWVTASGAVLDTAALTLAVVDVPHDPQADLCLRAGYLALRRIADFFEIPYDPAPQPSDPISVTRAEFDAVYADLAEHGLPLRPDREQAWRDFLGWRVNYDGVLLRLAGLTLAPRAPWSSDRALNHRVPLRLPFWRRRPRDA